MIMTKKFVGILVPFCLAFVSFASARSQPPPPGAEDILVGHISHVEGQLLRYVPEESDWVATVQDAPFGLDDALYSDEDSKAEFIFPNDTLLRTGGSTQIQLITLRRDVTEADVASGVARFYNRSENGVIKITTAFGYVIAGGATTFDLYVGDESVEVITLNGRVDFVHGENLLRYDVISGSSIVADSTRVTSFEANVDAGWDDWNMDRDRLWRKWLEASGDSGRYLPTTLRDKAYALEVNGRWEEVRYEGASRRFWRPTSVARGWSPFTAGRWTVYHGDNTWIPDEQFGYVTHHYGNWIYTGDHWYWAPPVARVQVDVSPFLAVGLGWYPGRVGWIHTGITIGWVPLAWNEHYYTQRRWGSRTTVVNTTNINQININISNYNYLDRAVVVNRDNFYSRRNYRDLRLANISRDTISQNYQAAPVVNDRVIDNYKTLKGRHNFSNVDVDRKPHKVVRDRILHNEQRSRQAQKDNAEALLQNMHQSKQGRIDRNASIVQPKVGNKLVRLEEVSKPRLPDEFRQKELKKTTRQVLPAQDVKVQDATGSREKQRPAIQQEKNSKKERQTEQQPAVQQQKNSKKERQVEQQPAVQQQKNSKKERQVEQQPAVQQQKNSKKERQVEQQPAVQQQKNRKKERQVEQQPAVQQQKNSKKERQVEQQPAVQQQKNSKKERQVEQQPAVQQQKNSKKERQLEQQPAVQQQKNSKKEQPEEPKENGQSGDSGKKLEKERPLKEKGNKQ